MQKELLGCSKNFRKTPVSFKSTDDEENGAENDSAQREQEAQGTEETEGIEETETEGDDSSTGGSSKTRANTNSGSVFDCSGPTCSERGRKRQTSATAGRYC